MTTVSFTALAGAGPAVLAAGMAVTGAAGFLAGRRVGRGRLAAAEYAAAHDMLTGLANRAGLYGRGPAIIRAALGRPVVVAVLDLRGFKAVNDTHGHTAGDQVLTEVASRLARLAGPTGLAARLGGDEFAMVAVGPGGDLEHDWLAGWPARVHTAVTVPASTDVGLVPIGVTVGAVLTDPTRRARCEVTDAVVRTWLHQADLAMYDARIRRQTTTVWTDPSTSIGHETPNAGSPRRVRDLARPSTRLATVPDAA